jgi:signal transduction histidine kinase
MGDPVLLGQLIRNLVDNAMRYNVPGGQVYVETVGHGVNSYVTVVNTGPIVSGHEIPALFEPFRRLRDRTGFEGGNGLGLSIVRAVAQAHGGDVSAAPRSGGGLQVRVTLPGGS